MTTRTLDAAVILGAGGLAAFFMLGADAVAARIDFPLDDAWIHLVYARNLWLHGMLSYNPGVPESGSSSLLWALVLAPLFGVCSNATIVPAVKIACALFAALTAAGVARIAEALHPARAVQALAAAWVLLSPAYGFAAVSGMEVALTSALLAWAIASDLKQRFGLAGVLLGLALLARPECALVPPALALIERRRGRAALARLLVPAAAAATAWVALNLWATGYPLPNTFYAKAQHDFSARGIVYLFEQVLFVHGAIYTVAAGSLAGCGLLRARRDPAARRLLVVALPLLAIPFVHELKPQFGFYMRRYFLPFTVFDAPFVALGLFALREKLSPRLAHAPTLGAALIALPALIVQRDAYIDHCHDIVVLHTRPALEVIAPLPKDALVAVEGAGASRFFGGHRVLDLVGLNAHALVHEHRNGVRPCYVMALAPSVFVVPSDWLAKLAFDYEIEPIRQYEVEHWSVIGGTRPRTVVAVRAAPRAAPLESCKRLLAAVGVEVPR